MYAADKELLIYPSAVFGGTLLLFDSLRYLAEREGFEPSAALRLQRFSRPPQSSTLAPLRMWRIIALAVLIPFFWIKNVVKALSLEVLLEIGREQFKNQLRVANRVARNVGRDEQIRHFPERAFLR